MTDDARTRQERIWALFEAALDLSDEDRAAFLERHGDDTKLVAEVEGLLQGHEMSGGILDQPLSGDREDAPPPDRDDPVLEARVRSAFEKDYGLVRELGMPAVLAMTDKVTIATAETLAENFYIQLHQHGYVDRALVEACRALIDRPDQTVPALFSTTRMLECQTSLRNCFPERIH